MTDAPADSCFDVIIVGAGAGGRCAAVTLLDAGITNFAVLERSPKIVGTQPRGLVGQLRFSSEVIGSVFDDNTHSWTVQTRAGDTCRGRVVIAAAGLYHVPWIPDIAGQKDFRGASFHSADWHHDFDPVDKRIAVIGSDASADGVIRQLTASAVSVEIFPHMPRRVAPGPYRRTTRAKQRLLRQLRPKAQSRAELVSSDIETLTTSGIRTHDGILHGADAIIYATGLTRADRIGDDAVVSSNGLTIQEAWRDGTEAYLGVAVHGFPNYFLINGPDYDAQARNILGCLKLMKRNDSTRIEVRRSSQQLFNERVHSGHRMLRPTSSEFDLSSETGVADELYDGAATLTLAETQHQVRVRLTGHFDPIDGQYHWQGMIFNTLPDDLVKTPSVATLGVGERSVPTRITERTQQGKLSITGVGEPPFALDTAVTVEHVS